MTILVTGATGTIGRALVHRLLESGKKVCALSRSATSAARTLPGEVEIREGSFEDAESLRAAMRGVDGLYLFADAATVDNVIQAAEDESVRRIVVLTSAKDERDGRNVVAEAVKAANVEWTVIEPGPFAMNAKDWWSTAIREYGAVRWVYAGASLNPIHEDDVADAAATALLTDDHIGREYYVTGPENLTLAEQVRLIGERLGKTIPYQEITPDEGRKVLTGHGIPDQIAYWVIDALRQAAETPDLDCSRTVEVITKRRARTFAQWVADHEADFRAS
jgi:uncharacterized protein YbjT (DUF2867 family)